MSKKLKLYIGLLLPLLVAACDLLPPPGPSCVAAEDLGDVTTKDFTIQSAHNGWIDSGADVSSGDQINVDITSGSLVLCGQDEVNVSVNATSGSWTVPLIGTPPAPIMVHPDDQLVVEVPDPSASYPGGGSPSAQRYTRDIGSAGTAVCSGGEDVDCWHDKAGGLIGKLGGGTGWDDHGVALLPGGWGQQGFASTNGLPLKMNAYGFTGAQPLSFIFYDTHSDYGDNAGGYIAKVKRMGCVKDNGQNAEFQIGGATITESLEGGGWSGTAWANGHIYLRIVDTEPAGGDGVFTNNIGEYKGTISTYDRPNGVSNAINFIIEGEVYTRDEGGFTREYRYGGVKPKLEEARELMYRAIITSGFNRVVTAILVLYVAVYGVLFMYGFIQNTQVDFLIRIVKMAVIIQLAQAGSWDFFNTYLFPIFTEGSQYVVHVFSTSFMGSVPPYNPDMGVSFSFLDTTLSMFFSQSTWIKISAILFDGPLGWLVVILIIIGLYFYLIAVVSAFILYLIAFVALSLLIATAPIFLIFMLFAKTMTMFKNWINSMFAFALRPVMVFAVLVIFNFFMYAIMLRVFNFEACWGCVCRLPPELLSICIFAFYKPVENSANCGDFFTHLPVSLLDVAMLIIVAKLTENFIGYSEKTAARIASASMATNLMSMATGIRNEGFDKIKQAASMVGGVVGRLGERSATTLEGGKKRAGVGDNENIADKGLEVGGGDLTGGDLSVSAGKLEGEVSKAVPGSGMDQMGEKLGGALGMVGITGGAEAGTDVAVVGGEAAADAGAVGAEVGADAGIIGGEVGVDSGLIGGEASLDAALAATGVGIVADVVLVPTEIALDAAVITAEVAADAAVVAVEVAGDAMAVAGEAIADVAGGAAEVATDTVEVAEAAMEVAEKAVETTESVIDTVKDVSDTAKDASDTESDIFNSIKDTVFDKMDQTSGAMGAIMTDAAMASVGGEGSDALGSAVKEVTSDAASAPASVADKAVDVVEDAASKAKDKGGGGSDKK